MEACNSAVQPIKNVQKMKKKPAEDGAFLILNILSFSLHCVMLLRRAAGR